ncbi:MAG: hypothetical protein JZU63_00600 [Rhodoferax sp.]|nr:hypothetical protein [Rhodoferax sp.]
MKFTDLKNREYECRVTVADAIELKKMGLDLMDHFDGAIWQKLADDLELLVNAIALTVRSQIEGHKIDPAEFARCLGGDGLEFATMSLWEAITDFSPPSQRTALRKLIEKTDAAKTIAASQLLDVIDRMTPEQILTSLNPVTNAQGSPGSSQVNSVESPIEN